MMLKVQQIAGGRAVEAADGSINRRAIGYIYGFINAALRTIGPDMSKIEISVPITYHILERLFPGKGAKYGTFMAEHMGTDRMVTLGAMTGGQQYVDLNRPGRKGIPMGLARYVIEGDKDTDGRS